MPAYAGMTVWAFPLGGVRHSREGGNPVPSPSPWMPAYAGMTVWAFPLGGVRHSRESGNVIPV